MTEQSGGQAPINPESLRRTPQLSGPKRVERHIQGRIVAGLLEMAPLLVTVIVIAYLVGASDGIRSLPFVKGQPWDFPGVGLLIIVVVAYAIGLLIITPPGRKVMQAYSWVMNTIPVVRTIFGVTRQAITSFSGQFNFSRVVFVEWPRDGMLAMGFVTGQVASNDGEKSIVAVYIPTVPNPTSGNMAFVIEDDVMETNLSVDDAMRLVFSGGIVLPESMVFARLPVERRNPNDFLGQYRIASSK